MEATSRYPVANNRYNSTVYDQRAWLLPVATEDFSLDRHKDDLFIIGPPRDRPFMHKDRIAIIGIGCRFPGGVTDAESFWKLLMERRDAVSDVPADRWNVERYYDPEPGIAGKTFAKRAGFLDQIDKFDPQFFGISPREAPYA